MSFQLNNNFLLTILLIMAISCSHISAQKHDYVWHMGFGDLANDPMDTIWGKTVMDFNDSLSLPNLYYNSDSQMDYDGVNVSVCDEEGNYLFTYNGTYVEDASHNVMLNGENMSESGGELGDIHHQGGLVLKLPGSEQKYVLIHQSIGYFSRDVPLAGKKVYYSIIDMNENNGLGKVVSKKNLLIQDTMDAGKITATRHANGRDWWILIPAYENDEYHKIILTPQGPEALGVEQTGQIHSEGLGHACFSPDGSKYAKFSAKSISKGNQLYFYDFNRCNGKLSNPEHHHYDIDSIQVGSISISPNSDILYLFSKNEIFQFDLTAENISSTKNLVAVNDGYIEQVPGTNIYTGHIFYISQLGPDGKIYICSYHPNRLLTTVKYPDSWGENCQVKQHSVQTPTMNTTVPNFPNYRLGPIDGSPCDTLGIDNIPLSRFRIDQDTNNYLKFQFVELADYEPNEWIWSFGDGSSSRDKKPSHTYSQPGVYKVCLTVRNENGTDVNCKKIYIATTSSNDEIAKILVDVFPNQCTSFLNVRLGNYYPKGARLYLYDLQGKKVKEQKITHGQNTIPVFDIAKGIYFYNIADEGAILDSGKIMKE